MDVDCIAFTGSTATGKLVMQYAAQSNLKRVGLECGGKSPNIVMADCPDLDKAATAAAFAIFFNQGEMCSAGSRLLVEESIKDELLERVAAVARKLVPGDPLDPATRLGAIVDEGQMRRVLEYIDSGRAEGAHLRLGGSRVREQTGGFYVEPTVFDAVTPTMRIASEEIFGPVLATITFRGVEQAIEIANDVIYGLAAAVWTRDITVAHRTRARAARRHGLRELLRRRRHHGAVRRLQAVGHRPRQVAACLRQVHRTEDHLDRPGLNAPRFDSPVAFVDVETTGGHAGWHRVTDVAIVAMRGGEVEWEWHSLVNPGAPIPPSIQVLTGISNEMVAEAPRFEDLAGEILRRLEGRTFVAHNVRFDYGFIRTELRRAGHTSARRRSARCGCRATSTRTAVATTSTR